MAKRLLVTAIERGLAGDITGELAESDRQERATQQAAQEVANMIAAGQGDRVIALFAAVAPNTDEDASNAAKTGLLGALARLPGELASRDQAEQGESPGESAPCTSGATDNGSDASTWRPIPPAARPLPLDQPATRPGAAGGSDHRG